MLALSHYLGYKTDSTYEKKSCIEGVTEEQMGSLRKYELDMVSFLSVSLVMVRYYIKEMMN